MHARVQTMEESPLIDEQSPSIPNLPSKMLRRGISLLLRPNSSAFAAAFQQIRSLNFFEAPNGPAVKLENIEDEWYNRQRPKLSLLDKTPWTQPDTWIAPNAIVAGDVDIYDQVQAGSLD